jgi:hypothetical protein
MDVDGEGGVTLHCQGGVIDAGTIVIKGGGGRPDAARTIAKSLHAGESTRFERD